jgi:hypothetical protein
MTGLRFAATLLSTPVFALLSAWGAMALWYQAPGSRGAKLLAATLWSLLGAGCLAAAWLSHLEIALLAFALFFGGLSTWWRSLEPSNDRDWADDVAEMTQGTVIGDRVTLRNVRNFAWRTNEDYAQRWETRDYALERLCSLDMIMSYWRGHAIAHMLMSFGFEDGEHVAFSVEIRRERTELYSELGGFFKEFELIVIAADERDAVRLRTNVRLEDAYLYRIRLPVAQIRQLFLAYIEEANSLVRTPRFYHTITVNCTTLVYHLMRRIVGALPFSYRVLLSGYMPEYVYSIGGLDTRYPLEELRSLGYVSERARRADQSAAFSQEIRRGVPRI